MVEDGDEEEVICDISREFLLCIIIVFVFFEG